MNLREDGDTETKIRDKYSLIGAIAVLASTILSASIIIYFGSEAIFSISLILFATAVANAEAWNKELRNDGYASLTQIQATYIVAFLFLPISIAPSLAYEYSIPVSVVISVIASIASYSVFKYILFRGVDSYEKQVETYIGPSVIYIPDKSYKDDIEHLAKKNRNTSKSPDT